MKKIIFSLAFCILTGTCLAQPANLDFENWYTDSLGIHLNNWQHYSGSHKSLINNFFGTWRDTIAEHGTYALTMSRWYQGEISDWVQQRASISSRPGGITGYYKYINNLIGSGNDTAYIEVFMTKWNTLLSANDTIASGISALTLSSSYTTFSCPIKYTNTQVPDSITISIMPTYLRQPDYVGKSLCDSGNCSFLTVDNLSFLPPADVAHIALRHLDIYPNPIKDVLNILADKSFQPSNIYQLTIMDMLGRVAFRTSIAQSSAQLNLSSLPPGNYFLIVRDDWNEYLQTAKLVKE